MGVRARRYAVVGVIYAAAVLSSCGSTTTHSLPLFEQNAAAALGLNPATSTGRATLKAVGNRICNDIKGHMTPDAIVADVRRELAADRGGPPSTAGVSRATADALLYVCPAETSTFNHEAGHA